MISEFKFEFAIETCAEMCGKPFRLSPFVVGATYFGTITGRSTGTGTATGTGLKWNIHSIVETIIFSRFFFDWTIFKRFDAHFATGYGTGT